MSRDADEMLVRVLVAAGKPGEALALGARLLAAACASAARRSGAADLLVGHRPRRAGRRRRAGAADQDVAAARRCGVIDGDDAPALAARLDARRRRGRARPVPARRRRAAGAPPRSTAAPRTDQPAGRVRGAAACSAASARGTSDASSRRRAWFERAAEVAERAGLASVAPAGPAGARASIDWADGGEQAMRATRDLAARYGALVTVAVMDLSLADIALMAFDRDGCLAAARALRRRQPPLRAGHRSRSRTSGSPGAHALAGDDAAMSAADRRGPWRDDQNDPRILGDLHGRVLATRSIVAGDLEALLGATGSNTMIGYVSGGRRPGCRCSPAALWWAAPARHRRRRRGCRRPCRASPAPTGPPGSQLLRTPGSTSMVRSSGAGGGDVVSRRDDDLMAENKSARGHARASVASSLGLCHTQLVLVAPVALRDGWGEPAGGLAARGRGILRRRAATTTRARRCRALLAEAGAPPPAPGSGRLRRCRSPLRGLGVAGRGDGRPQAGRRGPVRT